MYWMVLELMEGGELFERIVEKWEDHGGYTEREARETSSILLHTVAYLHERNIAHRDLKVRGHRRATRGSLQTLTQS